MWAVIAALTIAASPPLAPASDQVIAQAPYVSCRDGYIAPSIGECPASTSAGVEATDPPLGGGGGRRGLLGLGGLAGIL